MRMLNSRHIIRVTVLLSSILLLGCQPTTPPVAQRPLVTLPILTGNHALGKKIYDRECGKCHQLKAGRNSKAPQLERIYGATAATLADYQGRYSSAMQNSGWVWNETTLDHYLENPASALPDGKMLSDPLPDQMERQAVIAYLSTLR